MTKEAIAALEALLAANQPTGLHKIQAKMQGAGQIDEKLFFYLFAISTRWFDAKVADTSACSCLQKRDTFDVLSTWSWSSIARLYLLFLAADRNTKQGYIDLYNKLFHCADLQESIVLIQSLAFIPCSEAFTERAREAARSNITTLFSAVAHHSDYAYQHFDELGWNQLVLKAAFLGVPIISIHGLNARNNISLVTMLQEYARERQAASRSVPWDLWCCVAWAARTNEDFESLETQFSQGDIKTKAAIALALIENKNARALELGQRLSKSTELNHIDMPLTWNVIASYNS